METQGLLLLLLFLIFICRSFQDGNFTSFESLSPAAKLTGNAVVTVTLLARRADEVASPIHNSLSSSSSTSRTILQSIKSYQQVAVQSTRPSNLSAIEIEASLNRFPIQAERSSGDNIAIEPTFHVTNTTNQTIAEQLDSNHLDPSRRHSQSQRTHINDDSASGNDTRPQDSIEERWIAHQRRINDKKRKSQPQNNDIQPLKSPKTNPAPKVGLAALAIGALCFATVDPEKRRKRQKTQEQPEAPTIPSNEPEDVITQQEIRLILEEKQAAKVNAIYSDLLTAEAKCIDSRRKLARARLSLDNQQRLVLIASHVTLLQAHHDFFLASQHPSASPSLWRLASEYALPARLWRHGIYYFLEILRSDLPHSLDCILVFLDRAYSMMKLLCETVPAFENTWMEYMGDLGRYRKAIQYDNIQERNTWINVARHWYSKASNKLPTTGRLYHHLAILARPSPLQQLFFYSKSICAAIPYARTRESLLTLFDPVLNGDATQGELSLPLLDMTFVKAHELLFRNQNLDCFDCLCHEFIRLLTDHICQATQKFMEQGYQIAITNSVAMLGFGSNDNPIMAAMQSRLEPLGAFGDLSSKNNSFEAAQKLANATLEAVLQRPEDPNILPCVHVSLAFLHCISCHPRIKHLIQIKFPWVSLASFLNNLLENYDTSHGTIERDHFLFPENAQACPFPEDFAMRGLLWAEEYFPSGWFSRDMGDEDNAENFDLMTLQRKERILWLAARVSEGFPSCLSYDPASYNPINNEFNKPRFYPSLSSSSLDYWPNTIETSQTSSNLGASLVGRWLADPDRSILSRLIDDDPLLNGIDATLGLPVDILQDSPENSLDVSQPRSECSFYLPKDCPDSLESWLSDLINLDVTSGGSEEVEEFQIEPEPDCYIKSVPAILLPNLCDGVSANLMVLSQIGDDDDSGEVVDYSLKSSQEYDNDDDEQQDAFEEEMQRALCLPKVSDSNKLSHRTPPNTSQAVEKWPSEPLTKLSQYNSSFKSSTTTPSSLLLTLETSSSTSSPKPHTCAYCSKVFSRASDMNKHIKYHTRPINCQVKSCNYTCGRKSDLTRHQHGFHKDIHGEKKFSCPFEECKKSKVKYSRKDNLRRHLRQRHGGCGDEREDHGFV